MSIIKQKVGSSHIHLSPSLYFPLILLSFFKKTCNTALTFKVLRIGRFFMIWLSHDCFYFSLTFPLIHYIFQGIYEILLLSSLEVNNS